MQGLRARLDEAARQHPHAGVGELAALADRFELDVLLDRLTAALDAAPEEAS